MGLRRSDGLFHLIEKLRTLFKQEKTEKMAPVVKELQRFQERFKTIVCVTAQHREMLDQIWEH